GADLGGFRRIPSDWAIDWQFFVDLEHGQPPAKIDPLDDPIDRKPQHAYKIDTSLVSPLGVLPAAVASNPSILALRNLERGQVFELPSGQTVARVLGEKPISDDQLLIGKATGDPSDKQTRLPRSAPTGSPATARCGPTCWPKRRSPRGPRPLPVQTRRRSRSSSDRSAAGSSPKYSRRFSRPIAPRTFTLPPGSNPPTNSPTRRAAPRSLGLRSCSTSPSAACRKETISRGRRRRRLPAG